MGYSRDDYRMLLGRNTVKKKISNQEYQLQCWLALWLSSLRVLYCANAGSTMRTSVGVAVKIKRMGYRKGLPDMFIYAPIGNYHGMAIELKVDKYPSEEQKAWCDALNRVGYYAVIVPALPYIEAQEWVRKEVEKYLEINP